MTTLTAKATFAPSSTGPTSRRASAPSKTPTPTVADFFAWYNEDHRHSGIAFHTPADVHLGRAVQIREQRIEVLGAAYAAHPERFVRKAPEPPALPKVARINQPKEDAPITK